MKHSFEEIKSEGSIAFPYKTVNLNAMPRQGDYFFVRKDESDGYFLNENFVNRKINDMEQWKNQLSVALREKSYIMMEENANSFLVLSQSSLITSLLKFDRNAVEVCTNSHDEFKAISAIIYSTSA